MTDISINTVPACHSGCGEFPLPEINVFGRPRVSLDIPSPEQNIVSE